MTAKAPTRTFSGRADESKLQYADLVCNQELGISFGQFCAGELIDYVYETGALPLLKASATPNKAIAKMQRLIAQCALQRKTGFGALLGEMNDADVADFADSRYE